MEEFYPLLTGTELFCGISPRQIRPLLEFLKYRLQTYQAGEMIFLAGYEESEIGIVLAGEIEAERTSQSGESLLVTRMGPGGVFGDVLSGSHTLSPVTVSAAADCEVLFFRHSRLLEDLPDAPAARSVLLRNLVRSISDKYFALSRRLELLLIRSLRERITAFFVEAGAAQPVVLPINQTQLSAYLGCDRSALCRELGRMRRAGLLRVEKNTYQLQSNRSSPVSEKR